MARKTSLVLPANLQIANVVEFKEQVTQMAMTAKDLVIKAGAAERIDTAGLQMLLALKRAQDEQSKKLEWQDVGTEFMTCIDRLGGRTLLGL